MLKVIFSLDYEIHGNGEGDPYALMVEPTARMLNQFDQYNAKLTIMADVAEILRFKEHWENSGRDKFHYQAIADQLKDALRRGHDVQLHLHPAYFNAKFDGKRWAQDWSEYNFAALPLERMRFMIRTGKEFLENLLRPVNPHYRCHVFRAANWAVHPSRNIIQALLDNGITIDSSVFKHGRRDALVKFDYSRAPSNLLPWPADDADICRVNPKGKLWEFPIYCEKRWLGAFFSLMRIYRAAMCRMHKLPREYAAAEALTPSLETNATHKSGFLLLGRHAWKADFNQCSGRQLVGALERAIAQHQAVPVDLPFVQIGHSKLFTKLNEMSLATFLKYVVAHESRCRFGLYRDFSMEALRPYIPLA